MHKETCINTIRLLATDAVQRARSGHPGMPMGAAPMAYVLWTRHLRHDPAAPDWPGRDRFVLSAGHGSMLLYALLHLTGYALPFDELKAFRQWGSRTPGHPEHGVTPGVETTTGPLGQGFANGVGMAVAERHLAARFNREHHEIIGHHTYGIVSDGDLMEGVSHEAASLAGHLGLGRLIYLWDDNSITIDGSTRLAFTEDASARFAAYGWQVLHVRDGNDTRALDAALIEAKARTTQPTLIRVSTTIAYGSPNKAGTASAHGAPLGEDEVVLTKRALGWPENERFRVPAGVRQSMDAREAGAQLHSTWRAACKRYAVAYPALAKELRSRLDGVLPGDWDASLPAFERGGRLATRVASGKVLDALLKRVPSLIGGSADLTPSNKTRGQAQKDFQRGHPSGSYLRFGVREHAMAGVCNGISLHGGLRPYCGTFLVFSDYMRPSLRLSALMKQPVIYIFTHDSVGVGEDGPTHQAIEHVMALRAIPNLTVIRPADACETVQAWRVALTRTRGPTALILTRQGIPTVTGTAAAEGLQKGGYVLRMGGERPSLILIGTGSEVHLAVAAHEMLALEGIETRVVSLPSWELFLEQPQAYQAAVLPPDIPERLAVEAGITQGWERFTGPAGRILGINHYGASAPGGRLLEEFGFTADRVAAAARTLLNA